METKHKGLEIASLKQQAFDNYHGLLGLGTMVGMTKIFGKPLFELIRMIKIVFMLTRSNN